ncbi:hypothetical protein HZH66_002477 [Vespula vulgaris]|uniref:Uncharacterized protein n=1 Tax=Vespula vulgaris TaxID=7454 RepID=A0A834NF97_VESVU|nr:hypothetical protein HZH66_002477 [Vespula vulgaris]
MSLIEIVGELEARSRHVEISNSRRCVVEGKRHVDDEEDDNNSRDHNEVVDKDENDDDDDDDGDDNDDQGVALFPRLKKIFSDAFWARYRRATTLSSRGLPIIEGSRE